MMCGRRSTIGRLVSEGRVKKGVFLIVNFWILMFDYVVACLDDETGERCDER